ncbi:MAG: hypothetical protein C4562_07100 [Actinobacteria bacterium]|nr:MAG: hypothetical protein C4562_07100 [Actinomycetota bacterium]
MTISKDYIKQNKGFSLAEVMVAGAIMLTCIALFLSIISSMNTQNAVGVRSLAMTLAEERLRLEMREDTFVETPADSPELENVRFQKHDFSVTTARRYVKLDDEGNETESEATSKDLKRIMIRVQWSERRGNQTLNKNIQVSDFYNK